MSREYLVNNSYATADILDSIMQATLLLRAVGLNSNLLCDLDPLDFQKIDPYHDYQNVFSKCYYNTYLKTVAIKQFSISYLDQVVIYVKLHNLFLNLIFSNLPTFSSNYFIINTYVRRTIYINCFTLLKRSRYLSKQR